jgi:hypothetical protein
MTLVMETPSKICDNCLLINKTIFKLAASPQAIQQQPRREKDYVQAH